MAGATYIRRRSPFTRSQLPSWIGDDGTRPAGTEGRSFGTGAQIGESARRRTILSRTMRLKKRASAKSARQPGFLLTRQSLGRNAASGSRRGTAASTHARAAQHASPRGVTKQSQLIYTMVGCHIQTLPRYGGLSLFRTSSAPSLGPPRPGSAGQKSDRFGKSIVSSGPGKHYSLPSPDVYRARNSTRGATFGPGRGTPTKPKERFVQGLDLTWNAYIATTLPSPEVYKRSNSSKGTTFGPGRGSPVRDRFTTYVDITRQAYNARDLPPTTNYKETRNPCFSFAPPNSMPASLSASRRGSAMDRPDSAPPENTRSRPMSSTSSRPPSRRPMSAARDGAHLTPSPSAAGLLTPPRTPTGKAAIRADADSPVSITSTALSRAATTSDKELDNVEPSTQPRPPSPVHNLTSIPSDGIMAPTAVTIPAPAPAIAPCGGR